MAAPKGVSIRIDTKQPIYAGCAADHAIEKGLSFLVIQFLGSVWLQRRWNKERGK